MTDHAETASQFEFGVIRVSDGLIFGSGMSETEAREWVRDWNAVGEPGVLAVARRVVGEWEQYSCTYSWGCVMKAGYEAVDDA